MAWILMLLIDAVPYTLVVDTEKECDAIGLRMVLYYKARNQDMQALCRKTFEV